MLHPECKRLGIPLVAELGDPVCATYTPKRWVGRALRLEREVCSAADRIVVTSEATRQLLVERHRLASEKIIVITQGFPRQASTKPFERKGFDYRLRLVFTGRFYPFRDPQALLEAVGLVPEVELHLASGPVDRPLPPNVFAVGELTHSDALNLQASADVLVNIANEGMPQIPGKFFEYLGWSKPVLHIACRGDDEQAGLLRDLRRGWVVDNETNRIAELLRGLVDLHRCGGLTDGLDLSSGAVEQFSWARIADRFALVIRDAVEEKCGVKP